MAEILFRGTTLIRFLEYLNYPPREMLPNEEKYLHLKAVASGDTDFLEDDRGEKMSKNQEKNAMVTLVIECINTAVASLELSQRFFVGERRASLRSTDLPTSTSACCFCSVTPQRVQLYS